MCRSQHASIGAGRACSFLGLGSSLGDRLEHLQGAVDRLARDRITVQITAISPLYLSPHMGLQAGDETRYPAHLNCVVEAVTSLTPMLLLARIQQVEGEDGRTHEVRWGPRTIDIDILLYGDQSVETPALTLPHPGLAHRAFVVRPLYDLRPDMRLPDGRRVRDLLQAEEIRSQVLEPFDRALHLPI